MYRVIVSFVSIVLLTKGLKGQKSPRVYGSWKGKIGWKKRKWEVFSPLPAEEIIQSNSLPHNQILFLGQKKKKKKASLFLFVCRAWGMEPAKLVAKLGKTVSVSHTTGRKHILYG